jgi:hypothetical protein
MPQGEKRSQLDDRRRVTFRYSLCVLQLFDPKLTSSKGVRLSQTM